MEIQFECIRPIAKHCPYYTRDTTYNRVDGNHNLQLADLQEAFVYDPADRRMYLKEDQELRGPNINLIETEKFCFVQRDCKYYDLKKPSRIRHRGGFMERADTLRMADAPVSRDLKQLGRTDTFIDGHPDKAKVEDNYGEYVSYEDLVDDLNVAMREYEFEKEKLNYRLSYRKSRLFDNH